MSMSSSLNASVAGLMANANQLATTSDNIANSMTHGYKRVDTDFHAMVTGSGRGGAYSAGGVRTTNIRLIDERGPLVTTTNATDLAMGGRGMLPVTSMSSIDSNRPMPLMMTTTGSFFPDSQGYLTTSNGLVLLGWPADTNGTIPAYPRDTASALQPVQIVAGQVDGAPTTRVDLSVNLPATATVAGADGQPQTMTVEYFDNLGLRQSLSVTYTPTVPATGSTNTWTLEIADSASNNAVIASYTLVFDDSRALGGTLQSVTQITGGPYDPVTGSLALQVAGGPIAFRIGSPGQPDGMTQLSGEFAPIRSSRDGAPAGLLTGVEIDSRGMVYALYDTGISRLVFQIPVVDVPNPNGLQVNSNQTFSVSQQSGGFYLWNAGDGPAGDIMSYTREESTVDVARELTQLIQTQRAYSSNAKVIQTVDEMLQETTNIKR
ncbi:MAG: flagellar hook-basal body complex protein [Rubellimicrobium sp.]|nr:flagellar hook-basal body complex protein [Rubellimicrobium sp.]